MAGFFAQEGATIPARPASEGGSHAGEDDHSHHGHRAAALCGLARGHRGGLGRLLRHRDHLGAAHDRFQAEPAPEGAGDRGEQLGGGSGEVRRVMEFNFLGKQHSIAAANQQNRNCRKTA